MALLSNAIDLVSQHVLGLVAVSFLVLLTRNYFTPGTSSVPGPFLAKLSNIWRFVDVARGTVNALHQLPKRLKKCLTNKHVLLHLILSLRMPSEYEDAVQGQVLHNHFGNRVVESRTTGGQLVAVKVKPQGAFVRSEAEMMHFASQQPNILAPRVLGCYDVGLEIIATVTTVIPGQSLDKVWHSMDKSQRNFIKLQLKEQVQLYRMHTQPYIGRVNRQEALNFFNCLNPYLMRPFESEEEFDKWCLERVKSPIARSLWKRLLPGMRAQSPEFVLTHGDLSARNIMVHEGKVLGIVDWEYSGYFPAYMEYVLTTVVHDCIEDWWVPVLKEILEPCGFKKSRFIAAIRNRGW